MSLVRYGTGYSDDGEVEEVMRGGYNPGAGGGGYRGSSYHPGGAGGGFGDMYPEVAMILLVEEPVYQGSYVQNYSPYYHSPSYSEPTYHPPAPPAHHYQPPFPPTQQVSRGSGYGYTPPPNASPTQMQHYQGGNPYPSGNPYAPRGGNFSQQDANRNNRNNSYDNSDVSNSNNYRSGPVNFVHIDKIEITKPKNNTVFSKIWKRKSGSGASKAENVAGVGGNFVGGVARGFVGGGF